MRCAPLLIVFVSLFAVSCGGGDTKLKCTSDDDCHTDASNGGITYACDAASQVCLRACTDNTACLGGQHCDTAEGVCRDGTASTGDPGGGDPGGGDPGGGDPGTGD